MRVPAKQLFFVLFLVVLIFQPVSFADNSAFSKGYLVVTFDDGRDGALAYAAQALQQDGVKATMFVYGESLDQNWQGFLNLEGALRLQSAYGWEFEGHSQTHPDINHLTASQLANEVTSSRGVLKQDGFSPVASFAYPYDTGWDNATVLGLVKQDYVAARRADAFGSTPVTYDRNRQLGPVGCNVCPPDRYQLEGNVVTNQTTVQTIIGYLDQAITTHTLLILVFHQIVSANPQQYVYSSQDFQSIMAYAGQKIRTGLLDSLYFREAVQLLFGFSSSPPGCWLVCLPGKSNTYSSIVLVGASFGVVWAVLLVRWNKRKNEERNSSETI